MNASPSLVDGAPLDVLIIGAGISGIGVACYLSRELPQKSYAILEARDRLGGTWDLFRYPGVRSDSDLYTFAYAFKPWKSRKTFAGGDEILAYVREAAAEHGVDRTIRYRSKALAADWDSASALWRVTVLCADIGAETIVRCRWLFLAAGYYDTDRGHRPHFPDEETFRGPDSPSTGMARGVRREGQADRRHRQRRDSDYAGSGACRGRRPGNADPAHADLHPAVPFGRFDRPGAAPHPARKDRLCRRAAQEHPAPAMALCVLPALSESRAAPHPMDEPQDPA